jgi:predicted ATPase
VRNDLPSGTVTFLFTDVEGSTKLLEEIGDEAYDLALAEHRSIVRAACAAYGGVEVDTQGDSFFFAFPSADEALASAVEMIDALASGRIRLRIGLHTGEPRLSAEGYVGKEVHLAARVAATGHGGQVVLSQTTRALVDGPSFTDLGEHRLKDIEGAVPIYQLGDKTFPPLKTISNTNLPRPASSFVGRDRELSEVLAEINGGARLITLTGPGGSGKTRLAIEAAATLVPSYKAGVFWVGLASLREPSLVTEQIAQTLGAKDGLADHIGEREMLLLLDNLEQVVEAAPALSGLVRACPNLTLFCTSRELLRVQGEVEYAVPPLASSEAVALFCERSGLEPSADIAELCARLDDLPLAVELAAARTKALSPTQILDRLSDRLDLLRGGRDADARQQTLRATIAWSYDLLSEEEQRVFRALAVFVGGCTLDAADEVAGADLDTVQSFVEKSLLRFTNERYWMLETIREFALGELDRNGEAREAGERHTEFFLAAASELLAPVGRPTSDAQRDRFIVDQANFREAHTRVLEAGDGARAVLFVRRMWRAMWVAGSPVRDGYVRALASLELPGAPKEDRAYALAGAAFLGLVLGELDRPRQLLSEAEALFDGLGDDRGLAAVLVCRSEAEMKVGDYALSAALLERVVAIGKAIGDDEIAVWGETWLFSPVFARAVVDGDREAAERSHVLAEANVVRSEAGRWGSSSLDRALALSELAASLFALGEYADSIDAAQRSLREMPQMEMNSGQLMWPVLTLGLSACASGDSGRGITLIAAERKQLREDGLTEDSWLGPVLERIEPQARAALGDDRYEAAVRAGEVLSRDDAIELALSPIDTSPIPDEQAPTG